jgi:hypothetical protein
MPNNFNAKFISFIFLILLFLQQCSLFSTRTPEDPDDFGQIPFIQPDRPEIILQNLSNSITGLSFQNYLSCFSTNSFEFVPSFQASSNNPGIWENWSVQEEQTYFTNLATEASSFKGHGLVLSNTRYEIISDTKQQFIASYTLTVVHNRNSQGIPNTSIGDIILDLEADTNGLWYITKWTDISKDAFFSWSELKAVFVRG